MFMGLGYLFGCFCCPMGCMDEGKYLYEFSDRYLVCYEGWIRHCMTFKAEILSCLALVLMSCPTTVFGMKAWVANTYFMGVLWCSIVTVRSLRNGWVEFMDGCVAENMQIQKVGYNQRKRR